MPKRMLAVVVSEVEGDGEYELERRQLGRRPVQRRLLAEWLLDQRVEEVVMESRAQDGKPVWGVLERYWKPLCQKREGAGPMWGARPLAPAPSNRAPRGRKNDFADAQRLLKRRVVHEFPLSFVLDPEPRRWRTVRRTKYPLRRHPVQLQNRREALREERHLKLSRRVSHLLGLRARRLLQAMAGGETDPQALAALAPYRWRAPREELSGARGACAEWHPVSRRLLPAALEEGPRIETPILQLATEMARLLAPSQDQVPRRAEVPGLGVDSAQQIIAELGASAATFPSQKDLASGGGAGPGDQESAGVNRRSRSPKGNRPMRRILNPAAHAAVKLKGSLFALLYRRYVVRLGHKQTIAIVA